MVFGASDNVTNDDGSSFNIVASDNVTIDDGSSFKIVASDNVTIDTTRYQY